MSDLAAALSRIRRFMILVVVDRSISLLRKDLLALTACMYVTQETNLRQQVSLLSILFEPSVSQQCLQSPKPLLRESND